MTTLVACSAPTDGNPDPAPGPPPTGAETAEEPEDPDPPTEPEEPTAPPPDAATDPPGPFRGAWVHLFDDTLKHRAGVTTLVDELADAGANAVIAQVARRHDAYYDSAVLPATADPGLEPGFDVLAELTDQAHAAGLEVHAWLSVAPTWHHVYADLDAPAGWVATSHGRHAPEEARWVTRSVDGEWSEYLDPALPAVRDHVAAVVVELVERYPIDGIHLDYVRYESERHGYHPDVLARYRAETGAAGTPAPDDADWSAWRRAQTRGLVEHVREALAAAEPDGGIVLSAAVITWGDAPGAPGTPAFAQTRAATEALQDWPGWVGDGLVDAVMPMTYFRAHEPEQARQFAGWMAFHAQLAATAAGSVVPGIGGWLNHPDAVVEQVHAAMDAGDGAVVYSYQQPTEDDSRDVWDRLETTGWGAVGADEG